MLTPWFVLTFASMTVAWYLYVSGGVSFFDLLRIVDRIRASIFTDFLNPSTTQGLADVIATPRTPLNYIYKGVHLAWQGLVVVGVVATFKRRSGLNVRQEYLLLATSFLGMDLAGLVVPFFASSISTSRLFPITLIFLAPFGVAGGVVTSRAIIHILFRRRRSRDSRVFEAVGAFLIVYFLFNSGFVHQLANDPQSYALDPSVVYRPNFTDSDVAGAYWAGSYVGEGETVYSDAMYAYVLEMYRGSYHPLQGITQTTNRINQGDFIFLGHANTQFGMLRLENPGPIGRLNLTVVRFQSLTLYQELQLANRVYDNGAVEIFLF